MLLPFLLRKILTIPLLGEWYSGDGVLIVRNPKSVKAANRSRPWPAGNYEAPCPQRQVAVRRASAEEASPLPINPFHKELGSERKNFNLVAAAAISSAMCVLIFFAGCRATGAWFSLAIPYIYEICGRLRRAWKIAKKEPPGRRFPWVKDRYP